MPEVIEARRQALMKPIHQQTMDTGITSISNTANPSPSSSSMPIQSASVQTPTATPSTPNSITPKAEPSINSMNGPERPSLNALRNDLDVLSSTVANGPTNNQQVSRSSPPTSNASILNQPSNYQNHNTHNTTNNLNINQINHLVQNGNLSGSNSVSSSLSNTNTNNNNSTRSTSPYAQGGNSTGTPISVVPPVSDSLLNSPSKNSNGAVLNPFNGNVFNNSVRANNNQVN